MKPWEENHIQLSKYVQENGGITREYRQASFLELHLVPLGDPGVPIRIILVVARRTAKSFLGVELPGTEKSGSQTKCHSKPAY